MADLKELAEELGDLNLGLALALTSSRILDICYFTSLDVSWSND